MIHRVIAFGAREEFAAARRRLNRSLLADLDEKQAATLGSERERDLQTAILVLLHFDLPCYRGQSIGTALLRREAATMPVRQRSALANAVANATSLYEIVDVFPGQGIELRDLLRRFTVRVRERKASTMVQPGWLLLTKVRRQPDGTPVLDIPILFFDEAMRPKVDSWLSARRGGGSASAIDPRSVLLELYHMWQMVMATELTRPAPTILLQNHHGEPIEECEAELQCDESRLRS